MSLLLGLSLRLAGVAALCLTCAVLWIARDTHEQFRAEAAASAERIGRAMEVRPGLGSSAAQQVAWFYEWQMVSWVAPVAPGICVEFGPRGAPERRICGAWNGLGDPPPAWFKALFERFFSPREPVQRPATFRNREIGLVVATLDTEAMSTRAWRQIRIASGLAAALACGMCLLAALAVGHALLPAQNILRGLRRLEQGDYASRLPRFRTKEFDRLASAFNDLANRLQQITAERTELTRRLFEVQEHERRALARDLHDEFGQCLAATTALAASIEAGTPEGRGDLAEDARAISRVTRQMMATLKGALMRLRPPDLDDLGLEACLQTMVAGWNANFGSRTRFTLDIDGDLAAVPPEAALNVYRIVQECLTNAARHGRPARVAVKVSGPHGAKGSVEVTVEDDGGGDPAKVSTNTGFGILGIRERIGALGGSLAIGRSEGGVRISAVVPAMAGAAA